MIPGEGYTYLTNGIYLVLAGSCNLHSTLVLKTLHILKMKTAAKSTMSHSKGCTCPLMGVSAKLRYLSHQLLLLCINFLLDLVMQPGFLVWSSPILFLVYWRWDWNRWRMYKLKKSIIAMFEYKVYGSGRHSVVNPPQILLFRLETRIPSFLSLLVVVLGVCFGVSMNCNQIYGEGCCLGPSSGKGGLWIAWWHDLICLVYWVTLNEIRLLKAETSMDSTHSELMNWFKHWGSHNCAAKDTYTIGVPELPQEVLRTTW